MACPDCHGTPRGICPTCGASSVRNLAGISEEALAALGPDGLAALNAALRRKAGPRPLTKEQLRRGAQLIESAPWESEHSDWFSTPKAEALYKKTVGLVGDQGPQNILETCENLLNSLASGAVGNFPEAVSIASSTRGLAKACVHHAGSDVGALFAAMWILREVRELWTANHVRSREPGP